MKYIVVIFFLGFFIYTVYKLISISINKDKPESFKEKDTGGNPAGDTKPKEL